MRGFRRRYAAFRRWSVRLEERFAGSAFLIRLLMFSALLTFLADPGGVIMEYKGMQRAWSLGRHISAPDQLVCAFHEAGHAIVGRALDPDSYLEGLVVIDRNSKVDAQYYGYTMTTHWFAFLPGWAHQVTGREVMMVMAEAQGGVAVEAVINGRSCEHFANRVDEDAFDNDTMEVLDVLRQGYGLRYRVGWKLMPGDFGKDKVFPDEAKANAMLAEVRRIALGTVLANHDAIRDLALKAFLAPVRYGWHVIGENELAAVAKKHPLTFGRCR